MKSTIAKKIELLNKTTLESLSESDVLKIIKHFTDISLEILEADFGFAWWMTLDKEKYHLIYKSSNTPYEPELPRERGGNFEAKRTKIPFFVEHVKKENYEEGFDVSMHMKSYVIIPIAFHENIYGNMVICFKNQKTFTKDEKIVCEFIGTSLAQVITINRLLIEQQEKTEIKFIADATHELRTPLAIIKGTIDLALEEKLDTQQKIKKTLKDLNKEVDHMSDIVSDLAFLVSVKPGTSAQGSSLTTRIAIDELVQEIITRCIPLAAAKRISFNAEKIPSEIVLGNVLYLQRLFAHLINNAIAYGKEKGTIKVKGGKKDDFIYIDITDDGIGIPKNDLSHIFERFFRSENARLQRHDGTGLGLAAVKWIAEVHGGKVTVKSTEGRGSTFTVSLPIAKKE